LQKKATSCRFDVAKSNGDGLISHSNWSRIAKRGLSKAKVAGKRKKRTVAKITMKSEVSIGKVEIDLPLKTESEANCFQPWKVKYGRHKHQQQVVALALNPLRGNIKLPCKIMLTRFAPDELDTFDNLPMSFKYIVDAVCAIITGDKRPGQADGDKRITIACDQVKSKEYGVRVQITY